MSPIREPFRVLYVCTGNICRSAVAERLLRRALTERLGEDADLFEVRSAGVHGLVGEPMHADSAAALTALGGDSENFSARKLDADQVHEADLILTANRKHRANVVRLDPTAAKRAFTLREFALLGASVDRAALPDVDPASRLAAMVEEVAATRGSVRPDDSHDLDVADPYGGPPDVHRDTAHLINEATASTAGLMAAAARPDLATPSPVEQSPLEDGPKTQDPVVRRKKPKRHRVLTVIGILLLVTIAAVGWLAWTGLAAKRELEASRPLIAQARAAVLAGNATRARAIVTTLRDRTQSARSRTHDPVWAMAQRLPIFGDDVTAVRSMTDVLDDVSQKVLPPLLGVTDSVTPAKLRTAGNRINLAPLQAAAPTLSAAVNRTTVLKNSLAAVPAGGLTGPVARALVDVQSNVKDLLDSTVTASRAADLIPPLLGADGKRRYFLAFQNNAEARGTGGLLGAYGILEADHGRVRVVHLGPNGELKSPTKLPVDLGTSYRALYGRTPPFWVNGNVSAHFPYAGRIWTAMWKQQTGQVLDGVIATDPVALGYMLAATGPAPLPGGGQVTAANAVALTMKDVYARFPSLAANTERDAYLQVVAGAVFKRVLSGQGDARAMADQLAKAAGERRLLVFSSRDEEQAGLERTPLAGGIPTAAQPFAGLVVNNYSSGKLDYYLDRSLTYSRDSCIGAEGRQATAVTVSLTNTAPKGLPAYVVYNLDRTSFPGKAPSGASTTVAEVFATSGAELVSASLDGKALLVSAGRERGKSVFEFNISLLAGQKRTVVLRLSEPLTSGATLLLTPQPLVRPMTQRAVVRAC